MRPVPIRRMIFTVGVLAGSLALLGCPKRPEVAMAGPGAVGPEAGKAPTSAAKPAAKTAEIPVTRPAPPAEAPVKPAPAVAESHLKDIFFKFDDATILPNQKTPLDEDVAWLKAHPEVKATIAGNCDERGTEEYNLALGERRADVVKNYLVAAGIATDRISTISYGKDRPFALGHDDKAWRLNRRDHFVVAAK
ncbi:MAG TPA: peptidoglycan-associated lipoprotein Pal [Candidatus Methylomirabilis sp.]|nr:peptidoglycan-associated lipoprotein Pal [Candidatus Methylomirabilis sp.]